jgi:hypothetical protein
MIRDFIASIGKVNEYHKLKNKPMWKVVVYLLLISLLFGLVFSSSFQNRYSKILLIVAENYDTKVPEFRIENSQLKTIDDQKVLIEKDKGAIIFDTVEGASENSLEKYDYGVLILKDKFIIKTSKHSIMTKSWNQFNFEGYDKPTVREMIGSFPMIMLMLTILTVVGLFFIGIINSLFISLALLLAKKLWNVDSTYLQIFKMSIYSMTLPMILIAVLSVLVGDRIALTKYYYLFYISVIYLFIALKRGEVKPKVSTEANPKNKIKAKKKK